MSGAPGLYVCVDVGSTNSRAWLVRDGAILARETTAIGVRDSARDGSTVRVREAVRALVAAVTAGVTPRAILAAGMITSPLGLIEVPHLIAPVSAADLARGVVVYDGSAIRDEPPIVLIPGVRTVGASRESSSAAQALEADVMRGEETLVIGLLASGALEAGGALLNAGSHWKLIRVDQQRRIAASRTSLGGELVHAAQTNTLLAASLPNGPLEHSAPEWLEAGADAGRREGLLRALFGVRLLDQGRAATPEERFCWLVGACIADDIDALLRARLIERGTRVLVSGPAAIPSAWVHLLTRAGVFAAPIEASRTEQAFVTGLLEICHLRDALM